VSPSEPASPVPETHRRRRKSVLICAICGYPPSYRDFFIICSFFSGEFPTGESRSGDSTGEEIIQQIVKFKRTTIKHLYLTVGSFASLFAIVVPFFFLPSTAKSPEAILQRLSTGTAIANILVALYFLMTLLTPGSKIGRFFVRPRTMAAIFVYILSCLIFYNIFFRHLQSFEGLDWLVNELLHTFIPLLFVSYWFLLANKSNLKVRDAVIIGCIYPAAYLLFIFLEDSFTHHYAYPDFDLAHQPLRKVLLKAGAVLIFIFFLSFLVIKTTNLLSRKQSFSNDRR
jgi:hypothetical protein